MDGAARREELRLKAQALRLELQGIEAELRQSPPPQTDARAPSQAEDERQRDALVSQRDAPVDVSTLQRASEEREELLAKVQRQRALLEAIIKHMPGSTVIVLPPDGTVFYVNEVILGIHMGMDEERPRAVVSSPYRTESLDGMPIPPEEWAVVRALKRGETTSGRLVRVRHEKFDGIIRVNATPVYDEGGNIIAAIMMYFDATDEIQAEEEILEHRDRLEDLVARRTEDLEKTNQHLRAQRRHLRRLAAELAQTEENTRKELAVSLHDAAAQTLALALMKAQYTLQAADDPALRGHLEELIQLVKQAIGEVRTVIAELAPMLKPDSGLVQNLQTLGTQMATRYHYEVRVQADNPLPPMSLQACTAIYRSVRELLTNAGKYASASCVAVGCDYADDVVVLAIEDDGNGFDPGTLLGESSGGFGLFSIREHLAHLGGTMEIDSAPGQGARIMLKIPLQPSDSR